MSPRTAGAALALSLGLAAPAFAAEPPHTSAGQAVGHATDKVAEVGSDTWITAKVKEKVMRDDLAKRGVVHVDVKDHVVTLTGSAPSSAAAARTVELARATQGVREVVDRLAVTPAP